MSTLTKTAASITGAAIGFYHGYQSDFEACAKLANQSYGAGSKNASSLDLTLGVLNCGLHGVIHGAEEALVGGFAAYGAACLSEYYLPSSIVG